MQQTNMGLSRLEHTVQSLINRGLFTATLATYESGKRKYQSFCRQFHLAPLPVSESTLCRFVSFLFSSHLTYTTIKSYLAAIRHLQITHGLPDPSLASFPCLGYMLCGVRRSPPASTRKQRLPITHVPFISHGLPLLPLSTKQCCGQHSALDSLHSCGQVNLHAHHSKDSTMTCFLSRMLLWTLIATQQYLPSGFDTARLTHLVQG